MFFLLLRLQVHSIRGKDRKRYNCRKDRAELSGVLVTLTESRLVTMSYVHSASKRGFVFPF